MSKVKIEFKTDNDAFEGDQFALEVERILAGIAFAMAGGRTEGRVADNNGNLIGTWESTPRKKEK